LRVLTQRLSRLYVESEEKEKERKRVRERKKTPRNTIGRNKRIEGKHSLADMFDRSSVVCSKS
jgi:hypothetical protein